MSDKILNNRQQTILKFLKNDVWLAVSDIATGLGEAISPATLRRDLNELVDIGAIERQGENKGVKYAITTKSRIFIPYKLGEYYRSEESVRNAIESYNFDILPSLQEAEIFSKEELLRLNSASKTFAKNAQGLSEGLYKKELERFVIEFSWKSSKIEGNTYSLLDTEFLLRNGVEAEGKSKIDTKMIINHKDAYLFAVDSAKENIQLSVAFIEQVHHLLTKDLGIERGLRDRIVGISGSAYRPLALKQQLREQLDALVATINNVKDPYTKTLIGILGLSYLQPFEDGNKRTSRVLANSILLQAGFAPLSYRSVDEKEYKEATLIFYEQNSVMPFKELFIDQYIYSANHYNIAQPKN